MKDGFVRVSAGSGTGGPVILEEAGTKVAFPELKPTNCFTLMLTRSIPNGCIFQNCQGNENFGDQKMVTKIRQKVVTEIRSPKCLKMSDNFSKVTEIRAAPKRPKNEPKHHQNSASTSQTVYFCNSISVTNANLRLSTLSPHRRS